MAVDLFAGISVRDFPAALAWYERLLGSAPAFLPNDVEAVWEVGEHRYVYIELRPQHAGHSLTTLFVDDLEERVRASAERGIDPAERGDVRQRRPQGDLPRPRRQRARVRGRSAGVNAVSSRGW
jgi:hypothetical protein